MSALFNITKRAIQLAGASGALAVQIKEMSLRYFEDTCAGWIVGQGGWVSQFIIYLLKFCYLLPIFQHKKC